MAAQIIKKSSGTKDVTLKGLLGTDALMTAKGCMEIQGEQGTEGADFTEGLLVRVQDRE